MQVLSRVLTYLRLAAFPLAYGLTGALTGGTLNRIMIDELGLATTLVGVLFAVPLLVSPARIWLGYRSDGYPLFGLRREPYVVIGALLAAIGIILAVLIAINLRENAVLVSSGLIITFALFGFGRNLGHNTFQALITDIFSAAQRSRAITLYEVATLFGLVMGAGLLGRALEEYEPGQLLVVTLVTMSLTVVLSLLAAAGQEPRTQLAAVAGHKARELPFAEAFRQVAAADPQVRIFFVLIVFTFVGTLAQDLLLEPYGALVLNMSVGETTRLTAFWGVGVLISMLLSGIFLLKVVGAMRLLRVGLVISMLVFAGIIAVGMMGNTDSFRGLVLVMGLGTGLAGAGMLSTIARFTTPIRAGLLMGIWGFANLLGRAVGSIMAGAVVDGVMGIGGASAFVAYSAVFAIEIMMLAAAYVLSLRLHPEESLAEREERQALARTVSTAA